MTYSKPENPAKKENSSSFFSFLATHYELSKFVLPPKKPVDDSLNPDDKKRLQDLMDDRDFYEINTIIRKRYSTK